MANPALSEKVFGKVTDLTSDSKMTIEGTINKTGILLALAVAGACAGWGAQSAALVFGAVVVGFVVGLAVIFGPQRAPVLAPMYALLEGVALGAISSMYAEMYAGIVTNALILTFSCLFLMLALYRFQIIRVTDQLRSVVTVATMAIGLTYLVDMILRWVWHPIPMINDSTPLGIGFSVLVVGVAAFNLLLDFDLNFDESEPSNAEEGGDGTPN